MSSYLQREISLTFELHNGQFTNASPNNSNKVTVSGLRVSCQIEKSGGMSFGTTQILAYGLPLSIMNDLSTYGQIYAALKKNTVTVQAGTVGGLLSTVFSGVIQSAWIDFTRAPDVALNVSAYVGLIEAAVPASPTSYPGPFDVATAMSGFAAQMGYVFEDNNVHITLPGFYFHGTIIDQMQALAKAARINAVIDGGILAIWPMGGARSLGNITIGPTSGLVGYPTFSKWGVNLRSVFNPTINYGTQITVESELPNTKGPWAVFRQIHLLDAHMPGGNWFTDLETVTPGQVILVP